MTWATVSSPTVQTLEGRAHPDREAQFQSINRRAKAFQKQGQPVVSVDTKKKELIGQFRTWRSRVATPGAA